MKLQAQIRDTKTSLNDVRKNGEIPAVCYGPELEATTISVDEREFIKLNRDASGASIIDLEIEGEKAHEVLIKDISREPVSEKIQHIDLYAIKRGAEIEVAVPLVFVGESPAARSGAVLTEILHEVRISCRPRDLQEQIEVDLSLLSEEGSQITVGDIIFPDGITVLNDSTDTIATANAVQKEVEETVQEAVEETKEE